MIKVVGVRFRQAGKIYYFDPADLDLDMSMHVIVETARGVELGTVLIPPKEVEDDKVVQPLKPVIRIATDDDENVYERNREREKEAFAICKEKIIKHGLEMKLVGAEYTFDSNKLLFYFTADGRVDFRDLVKDLAAVFRTRIELRQIGVRDETKLMGGVGVCGRALCCSTYLSDFVPVSIKMAKEQNLSLNPTKISGMCGRLMCCLKNEQETYEYLNSRLPSVGDTVIASDGTKGEVSSVNVLRQLVKVIVDTGDEKEMVEYKIDDLRFKPRRKKDYKLTEEELKELEGLEEDKDETVEPEKKPRGNKNGRDNQRRRDNPGQAGNPQGGENRREGQEKSRDRAESDQQDAAGGAGTDVSDSGSRNDNRERRNNRNRRNRNRNFNHRSNGDGNESGEKK
jgi:cell fate regulator YaaT (PSP1 superfamily)